MSPSARAADQTLRYTFVDDRAKDCYRARRIAEQLFMAAPSPRRLCRTSGGLRPVDPVWGRKYSAASRTSRPEEAECNATLRSNPLKSQLESTMI